MKTKTKVIIGALGENDDSSFIPVIGDTVFDDLNITEDNPLPLLTLRNVVLFPGVVLPISVGRKKSLRLIKEYQKKGAYIGAVAQIDKNVEEPSADDLFEIGTVAQIVKLLEMPDGTTTAILQGVAKFQIKEVLATEPYMTAKVSLIKGNTRIPRSKSFKALVEAIKENAVSVVKMSGNAPQEVIFAIKNIENVDYGTNFIAGNLSLELEDKQAVLACNDIEDRANLLLSILTKEVQMLEIKSSIQNKAMENIDKQQREYFLQQQIKTIQSELGGTSQEQDVNKLRQKAKEKKWNDKVNALVEKEINKIEALSPQSPDYSIQMNYVETLLNLPWNEYTVDNFNLKRAQKRLDADHYGMEDVKERIIEHLAVLKLKGDLKSPIICLYGPPGVGKTSLGKSVAEALGRKYARISLGGLHDEAEIRGHRRTYIGAMPGRIIQNIIKCGSSNPVFILDEIDKVGADYKGDPASALLEVLDPEQNNAFHDNYIDIDYDLSKILFIATANDLSTISRALLDRMEVINISGYIEEEKVEIASRHLIPRQWENHGISKDDATVSKKAISYIIEHYTRESGVRTLDKQIAKIARKIARNVAMENQYDKTISDKNIVSYLGTEIFDKEKQDNKEEVGIVTGLAWTQVGGEILEIETSLNKCKGDRVILTGNLGDVMKESATLGIGYIKAHAKDFGIDESKFEDTEIRIHVPEGAVPKDGPSAGITMATSILSAFTGRKVKKHIAMTGEITLHGKVLPVGGIKEKILAAKRAGVTDIILCKENKRNIDEIKECYLSGLTFHYVTRVEEVFDLALKA